LLSPEGRTLRRALVAELLHDPDAAGARVGSLGPLLSADPSLSGRRILDRLVAFLFSPEGEETRQQLAAGFQRNGSVDLVRIMDVVAVAQQLHPEFRASTLLRALGSYLWSDEGKPARNEMLAAGAQRLLSGVLSPLSRLARPIPPPSRLPASSGSEGD
jgi:hypothetical protein